MLDVVQVAALVVRSTWPRHLTMPGHVASLPLSEVGASICEDVRALAIHAITPELALVRDAVRRSVRTLPVLLATLILAVVARPIRPHLRARARLLVFAPLALVGISCGMDVDTLAMSSV